MPRKPAASEPQSKVGTASPTQRYQAPALEKGLDVLELLSRETHGLSQKDIAVKLGRSVNEIFRMLICLEERNYIFRENSNDTYKLSLKLFELGLRNPPTKRLVEAAAPALQVLAKEIDQACHVAIHSGGNVLVVAQQNSPQAMGFTVNLGAMVPIQSAVSGIVLLSYLTEDVREHWLSQTAVTKAEANYLKKAYPSVLKNGYFKQESQTARGVTELACPVFGHTGNPVATVSVPILQTVSEDINVDEYIPSVKMAALEISRQIGWTGEAAGN